MTYRDLEKRIQGTVQRFSNVAASGDSDEVLAIQEWNSVDLAVAILASFRSGRALLLLSPRLSKEQVQPVVDSQDASLISSASLVGRDSSGKALGELSSLNQSESLMLTSGSTGAPKVAGHSASNHVSSAMAANSILKLRSSDRCLWSLPAFHIGGMAILWRAFIAGSSLQIVERGDELAQVFEKAPPTIMSLVPTQLRELVDQKVLSPPSVRTVIVGGAPILPKLLSRALALGYPIRTTFGMTETSSMISLSDVWNEVSIPSPVHAGMVLPRVEIRTSADGRLGVRGDMVFRGYRDPASASIAKQDDWWLTQDRVSFTPEGCLLPESRVDAMIISGGENIDPAEIEHVMNALPGVESTRVVGIPDTRYGSRPVAFVEMSSHMLPSEEWFKTSLASLLAGPSIPNRFYSMPRAKGDLKYSKRELAELAIKLQSSSNE